MSCLAGLRDVRGFAVKFYTEEGNWDLTGNNLPVSLLLCPPFVRAILPKCLPYGCFREKFLKNDSPSLGILLSSAVDAFHA